VAGIEEQAQRFPASLRRHRLAVLDVLEETCGRPGGRAALRTRGSSMAPFLLDGDEVVIEAVDPGALAPGDLIAYKNGDALLVHRVVVALAGQGDERRLWEKGDRNLYLAPVHPGRVLGAVVEVGTGSRRIGLMRWRFRLLGRAIAAYGILAVKLHEALRRAGRGLPGEGAARAWARAVIEALLRAPGHVVLSAARRWL
jgi:hypothetical protein